MIVRQKYLNKILPFIDKNIIKVLVGQRRTGKSVLLKSIQELLLEKDSSSNIIYINKELYEFDSIKNGLDLYNYINKRLKKKKNYVFIDEVQEIDEFEKILRDLQAREITDIYITGSNAHLLSGELATFLSGRYIEIKINPLSFNEFVQFHQLENQKEALDLYLRFGGMPYLKNIQLEDEIVNQYLRSLYDTILLKDIVARYNIRNVDFLIRLTEYLAENIGSIISAKKISDYLKNQKISIPTNTVISYLNSIVSTFLVKKIQRQEVNGKKVFEINEKYFFEDIGLRNVLIGFRVQDISKILENVVYMHLNFLGYDVKVGVLNDKEIDFIASKDNKQIYIQVCYLLKDEKTIEREFGNLLNIKDNYEKIVISMDEFSFTNFKGIQHQSMLEFLTTFN